MAVLSFFFPIVGWILWAVKKDQNPEDASKCAKWAWIGFGVGLVCALITSFMYGVGLAGVLSTSFM